MARLLLVLLPVALGQRQIFEPFAQPTDEVPETRQEQQSPSSLDTLQGSPGAGFGGACTHDAQCGQGLVCARSESGAVSHCVCSPTLPIYVQHAGVGTCVRAKSLYESCVSSAECSHDNPNVQCVDFLCYCPLPYVLTEDRRCLAPPGFGYRASAVAPLVMLSLTVLLGIAYLYHRVYREGWVPSEPNVVAVMSTDIMPAPAPPLQPVPRFIRPANPLHPPSTPSPEDALSDKSYQAHSPSAATTPKGEELSPAPDSPQCVSSGRIRQKDADNVAVSVPSQGSRRSPAGDYSPEEHAALSLPSSRDAASTASPVPSANRPGSESPQQRRSAQPASPTTPRSLSSPGVLAEVMPDSLPGSPVLEMLSIPGSVVSTRVLADDGSRRSRKGSSVDDSFMRELKDRLRVKTLLGLRKMRLLQSEAQTSQHGFGMIRSPTPPAKATTVPEVGVSAASPPQASPRRYIVARAPAPPAEDTTVPEVGFSGMASAPCPYDEAPQNEEEEVNTAPTRVETTSQTSELANAESPLPPSLSACTEDLAVPVPEVPQGRADARSDASNCVSPFRIEDYQASVRSTVALSLEMPAVVVAASPAESGHSDSDHIWVTPATSSDSVDVYSEVPPSMSPAAAGDSVLDVRPKRGKVAWPAPIPEEDEGGPSRAIIATREQSVQAVSELTGQSPLISRRTSGVQTEVKSSTSWPTTGLEASPFDDPDRDTQMLKCHAQVLLAGNAHYLRERSAIFRGASTLDETIYICQQIRQQQEPPARPPTAASEVFVTGHTTELGSSCESREPLLLRHLVGLQHPDALLAAHIVAKSRSPSDDECKCSSPPPRPEPRRRRLAPLIAEPKCSAPDTEMGDSSLRPKPRTRLLVMVPPSAGVSSSEERRSDSTALLMPDSAELGWLSSPSSPR